MQFSLTTLKARKLAVIIMFLIISVVALISAHYESAEQKEIREWAGAPKSIPWPVYVALALGAGVVYIMVAKIEERRLRYIGACLPAAALLSIYLLDDFWWNWIVGYTVMLAIVLIGWLYPARNSGGGQI